MADLLELLVIDISDPTNLTLAGSYIRSYPKDVHVSGNYAYVADSDSGLLVIDISYPASPTLAGAYDTSGGTNDVYVSDNYAYVDDEGSGLLVIDISDPTNPTLAGGYYYYGLKNDIADVYISGNYAYVAAGSLGLQIIKINDPVTNITVLDSNTITATFPAGLPEGPYRVLVTNPGGKEGILHNGFRVAGLDVTPPAISDVEVMEITDTSELLTWHTDEPSGSVVEYGIESGVYTDSVSDSSLVTSHSIELTDLTSETTYYFIVKSTDSSGNSAQSEEFSFTTEMAVGCFISTASK